MTKTSIRQCRTADRRSFVAAPKQVGMRTMHDHGMRRMNGAVFATGAEGGPTS